MSTQRLDLPVAVTLRLQSRSGRVDVIAEPREDLLAEGDKIESLVEDNGATLKLRNGAGTKAFVVRCPLGTDIIAGTQSGSVSMSGRLGVVSVTTMSGDIKVEAADEVDLRTVSGSLDLGTCAGRCRLNTGTGKVSAHDVGAVSAGTMSGTIKIDCVSGAFKARTVSGSINAACRGQGAITVKTVSGTVHIELPHGVAPHARLKTLSGRVRCDCPDGNDVLIEAMTVSGTIEVVPA